jgi:hypothetical protein
LEVIYHPKYCPLLKGKVAVIFNSKINFICSWMEKKGMNPSLSVRISVLITKVSSSASVWLLSWNSQHTSSSKTMGSAEKNLITLIITSTYNLKVRWWRSILTKHSQAKQFSTISKILPRKDKRWFLEASISCMVDNKATCLLV